ncbi:TPA: NifU family protein [Candidatus Uhrbacteria bacterium]|nr:NifU family protein [Candidatus Uhrbacteria bacterium]
MEALILSVLAEVSQRLAGHGGGVEFVGFNQETGILEVSFAGACRTCPLAAFTLEHAVAAAVKEKIPQVLKVILVPYVS